MKLQSSAPPYLIELYKKEGQAKPFLRLILSDPSMERKWTKLCGRIRTDEQWLALWMAIKESIGNSSQSRKPKRVVDEADDLRSIAAKAEELAVAIKIESRQSRGYKGFFDLHCHQFCPPDVMKINGINGWEQLDQSEQYAAANGLMPEWPTMSELLYGLAEQARARAGAVRTARTVLKDKERWSETMFIRTLYGHLNRYQWKPSDGIYATIATLTNLAIRSRYIKGAVAEEVTSKFARNAATQ